LFRQQSKLFLDFLAGNRTYYRNHPAARIESRRANCTMC
jgi:hypothetical protein